MFANVKIGTDLNCDKERIPTAKIGVFRMYLGSKKDAENMTSVPDTIFPHFALDASSGSK